MVSSDTEDHSHLGLFAVILSCFPISRGGREMFSVPPHRNVYRTLRIRNRNGMYIGTYVAEVAYL